MIGDEFKYLSKEEYDEYINYRTEQLLQESAKRIKRERQFRNYPKLLMSPNLNPNEKTMLGLLTCCNNMEWNSIALSAITKMGCFENDRESARIISDLYRRGLIDIIEDQEYGFSNYVVNNEELMNIITKK